MLTVQVTFAPRARQLPKEGAWLVKPVHMVRVPKTGAASADWESYWVTLAFHTAQR
jgi:hypothetical protein